LELVVQVVYLLLVQMEQTLFLRGLQRLLAAAVAATDM
jgi:hypothetical protein